MYNDELYHYGRKGMKWGQHIYGKASTGGRRKGVSGTGKSRKELNRELKRMKSSAISNSGKKAVNDFCKKYGTQTLESLEKANKEKRQETERKVKKTLKTVGLISVTAAVSSVATFAILDNHAWIDPTSVKSFAYRTKDSNKVAKSIYRRVFGNYWRK